MLLSNFGIIRVYPYGTSSSVMILASAVVHIHSHFCLPTRPRAQFASPPQNATMKIEIAFTCTNFKIVQWNADRVMPSPVCACNVQFMKGFFGQVRTLSGLLILHSLVASLLILSFLTWGPALWMWVPNFYNHYCIYMILM